MSKYRVHITYKVAFDGHKRGDTFKKGEETFLLFKDAAAASAKCADAMLASKQSEFFGLDFGVGFADGGRIDPDANPHGIDDPPPEPPPSVVAK